MHCLSTPFLLVCRATQKWTGEVICINKHWRKKSWCAPNIHFFLSAGRSLLQKMARSILDPLNLIEENKFIVKVIKWRIEFFFHFQAHTKIFTYSWAKKAENAWLVERSTWLEIFLFNLHFFWLPVRVQTFIVMENSTRAKVTWCASKARDANGEAKNSRGPIYTFKRAHKSGW